MQREMRRVVIATGVITAVTAIGALVMPGGLREPSARASASLDSCAIADVWGGVECGTLQVPVDRDEPDGDTLELHFIVVRAIEGPGPEPIFFFTGGPGSAASQSAAALAREFAESRQTRDLVLIDQRGTGRSMPLHCERTPGIARALAPMFDESETAACLRKLKAGPDLRQFTTTEAARDVESLRQALKYNRINVHGSSYGSRVAWTYAAMFPNRVRAMILYGPVPPGFHVPLEFSRGLDIALGGLVSDCEADRNCHARYPNLRRDLARAFEGVRAAPGVVTLSDDAGAEVTATMAAGEVAEALRYLLYTSAGARSIPALVTQAAAGNYTPLARAAVGRRKQLDNLYRGMYLSVSCAEDIPFLAEEEIRAATAGTYLGDYRVRQQQRVCALWPRGAALPEPYFAPVNTPTLVLAGQYDPATPLSEAERAMTLLPNGHLVVIPHGAHSLGGFGVDVCVVELMNGFVERGSAGELDTTCVAAAKRPAFY